MVILGSRALYLFFLLLFVNVHFILIQGANKVVVVVAMSQMFNCESLPRIEDKSA